MSVRPFQRWSRPSLFGIRPGVIGSLLVVVCWGAALSAQEEPQPVDVDQQRSRERLKLMQQAVKELVPASSAMDKERLQFAEVPILRYNDQLRQFFDATVWRLGTKGRPTALLTLEWYGSASGRARLMREFCSLSSERFTVEMPGVIWQPQGTDLKMRPLSEAPAPAATDALRLVQMRAMARRFAIETEWRGERHELRLVPQPIDRYTDPEAGIVDGSIFSFATGTNPELALLLEAGEEDWSFGTIRVALASLDVSLDGLPIESFPAVLNNIPSGNYFSASKRVQLPE